MPMKLSDYVVQFIAEQGVKHVFLLPGGGAMHLNDSLGKCTDIDYVCNLHEQASAIAAEAYARVTNNLGVAMVTTGPGGTNTVTGVAGAWLDSTPCLFVSGQVKRADLKAGTGVRILGVQEIDIVAIVKSITKYAVTVLDPASIRFHLEKAIYLARHGRPGPVWIDIPLDVQAAEINPDQLKHFDAREAEPAANAAGLKEKVLQAIDLLNAAERPVLLAGNGIRVAGGQDDFLTLVERLGIPVLTTWLGLDLLPEEHSLFVGRPGSIAPRGANFTLQNCDCLLAIGTRLDMALTAYAHDKLARAAKKILVDIDPAEIRKMKTTIHLPVVGDARAFLHEMLRHGERLDSPDRSSWLDRCRDWKARYPVVLPEHRSQTEPVSMYYFSEVLCEELAATDVIVPGSSGFASEIFFLCFKAKAGQRIFHNRGTGAMGLAQPASLGACLASGRRRTVSVDGDGGFQMNAQELATIARLRLPIKFFVINNQGYASIRTSQRNYFGRLVAADASSGLKLPELRKIAAAYDVGYARIGSTHELRPVIREVLAAPGPVVCEVLTPPEEPRGPRVASVQRPDGTMVSKPLEDLWPFLDRAEFRANMIVPPLDEKGEKC
jgi:acetolactate synthase-1/2/3 large subunit